MPTLTLKPTHKAVADYFAALKQLEQHGLFHEGAVSPAFAALLRHCAGQFKWTLAEQHRLHRRGHTICVDGALLDPYNFVQGGALMPEANELIFAIVGGADERVTFSDVVILYTSEKITVRLPLVASPG